MLTFRLKMIKKWIRLCLLIILTLGFLYFFLKSVEWKEALNSLTDVDIKFLILFIVFTPLHLVSRAIRWNYLLKNEKKGVKFYNRFAGNALGFTISFLFPGRLGELVKPLYLAQKENIRKGFVLGTVVVERIFDIFTMCFLLGLFLVFKSHFPPSFRMNKEVYSNLYILGISGLIFASLVLFLLLFLFFFKEKTLYLISIFLKVFPKKFSKKILELFEEFLEGLKFFHSIKNLAMYILWSLIVWFGIIVGIWLIFFTYNISIPLLFVFPYAFFIMVGAAIPTPGMVGGFHYFSKLGLITLFNIDANLAVGMTIVFHSISVVMNCLVGYLILWKEGLSLIQIKKLGSDIQK